MKRRNSRQDLDLDGRVNLVGPTDHDLVKYDDGDFGFDNDLLCETNGDRRGPREIKSEKFPREI